MRGIDGTGLWANVLEPYPGSGYETNRLWLARVRDGALEELSGAGFLEVR